MKKLPWLDYSGKVSPLKTATLIAVFIPGLVTLYWFEMNMLGARPITEVIHEVGLWGIRLLAITLAITPFRQTFRQPKIALIRRMTGVAAFTYLVIHFSFFIVDEKYNLATVASEIVKRFYLTIGFVTLLMLLALAVTSTDGMMRRLGRRWRTLHRLLYVAIVLGVVHYFIQSKLKVSEPTWFGGMVGWLLLYRVMAWRLGVERASSTIALALLSIVAGILTAVAEAGYYGLFTGVPPLRVWQANFTLMAGLRPGWIVMLVGLAVTLAATLWRAVEKWMPTKPAARRRSNPLPARPAQS